MAQTLTETQSAALFDILSHHDTYAEIRNFRHPKALEQYGPPFLHDGVTRSTSPALQSLVFRFALNLPGLRDLPEEFWKVQLYDIIEGLEAAELSESYDKGSIGSRKTVATAVSALIEYPVRGTYGGFANVEDANSEYDLNSAEDLSRAFRGFLDQAVYGDVLDRTAAKITETDQLSDHEPLIQAVHEFMLVNIASLLHYTLILTPKGQYLAKLIDNINKLVPYVVIRQTLKIGNVATMINAMVRVVLAKLSVASITNWIGLTQTEDEGMNLLQQIVSTVLSWDNRDLESRGSKIEKEKNGLSKNQIQALKDYLTKSREDHERIRKTSREQSVSIVMAIFNDASISTDNVVEDDSIHRSALDYLSIQLSIRDRKEIIRILCHSVPDHFTTSVRNGVSAYDPVIRQLHNAVDLSDTAYDCEIFLKDLLKLSRIQPPDKSGKSVIPTVGDFVQLLKKHQHSLHKFLHQVCKNGPEIREWYLEWAKTTASHFKRHTNSSGTELQTGAGDLSQPLNDLFDQLADDKKEKILKVLDAQTQYLDEMHSSSTQRLASVIDSSPSKNPAIAKILLSPTSRPSSRSGSRPTSRAPSPNPDPPRSSPLSPNPNPSPASVAIDPNKRPRTPDKPQTAPSIDSDPGPGAFLARWQDLLESTPITPLTAKGPVQSASSKEVIRDSALDVDGTKTAEFPDAKGGSAKVAASVETGKRLKKPDPRVVIECLGDSFRSLLAERSCEWSSPSSS